MIRLLHRLATTITGLLIGEDITNYSIEAKFSADGGRNFVEVVDDLLKIFPCFAFREDWVQGLEVIFGQCPPRRGRRRLLDELHNRQHTKHGWGCTADGRRLYRLVCSPLLWR